MENPFVSNTNGQFCRLLHTLFSSGHSEKPLLIQAQVTMSLIWSLSSYDLLPCVYKDQL